jgi:cytoskeletal protein CcmA (bactofilin family)
MGRIDDPTSGEVDRLKSTVQQHTSRTPLSDSAVSEGQTQFIGDESLRLDGSGTVYGTLTVEGVEVVNGELRIRGSLNVSGPTSITGATTIAGDTDVTGAFNLKGPATISGRTSITGRLLIDGDTSMSGAVHITGPTAVDGTLEINGDTDITGDTTLSGDLNVADNGHIKVGDMTIGKSGSRGKVDFGTGEIASDGTKVAMQSGAALVGVGGGIAQLTYGGDGIRVDSNGAIRIGSLPVTDKTPNLYIDDNLRLWRTTGGSGGGVSV